MRWIHPTRGTVPPAVFIPIAEETGLIIALGEWVLQQRLRGSRDLAARRQASRSTCRRCSSATAASPLQVVSALAQSGLPAQRLELEITERVLLERSDGTLAAMQQLKNLGVGISLDDFGTGYSSLNYLRQFPFHKIKIDQSFIRDLGEKRDARPIISAVASLGAGLDKIVVAEGIETEEQMALVRAQGCHEGQGHYFGRPMSGEAIRERLQDEARAAAERVA